MGKGYAHLSAEERELIAIGVAQGCSRRNSPVGYCGVSAHAHARERRRRCRRPVRLLQHSPQDTLWCCVVQHLRRGLSPQQAAGRIKARYPTRPELWVSHQTIYRAL